MTSAAIQFNIHLSQLLKSCADNLQECNQLIDEFKTLQQSMGKAFFDYRMQQNLGYAIDKEDDQMVGALLMIMRALQVPFKFTYLGYSPYQLATRRNNNTTIMLLERYGIYG